MNDGSVLWNRITSALYALKQAGARKKTPASSQQRPSIAVPDATGRTRASHPNVAGFMVAFAIALSACTSSGAQETTVTPASTAAMPAPTEAATVETPAPTEAATGESLGAATDDTRARTDRGDLDLSAAEEACLKEIQKYGRPVVEDLPPDATFEEYEAALEQRERDLEEEVWKDTPACQAAEN